MSERKLVHIEKVVEKRDIPNADNIEVVTVLGWEVVVKKSDNIKVGDLVVYIEIDSIVPSIPEFYFLEPRRYRIKTIKLKKQISCGLIIPLEFIDGKYYLPHQYRMDSAFPALVNEGDDVTKFFGVTKYDPQLKEESDLVEQKKSNPIHKYLLRYKWYRDLFKKAKGWPSWVLKTDEERIQNLPSILERNANEAVYVTEKLDGQSASYTIRIKSIFNFFKKYDFYTCSRNIGFKKVSKNNYWSIAQSLDIENKMKKYGAELTIQGEIVGPGIQKNKYNLTELQFWVYNIHGITQDIHCGYYHIKDICAKLGLQMVPLIYIGLLKDFAKTVPEIVEKSKGDSVLLKRPREGIVVRTLESRTGQRPDSFKVISPDFLLKEEAEDEKSIS